VVVELWNGTALVTYTGKPALAEHFHPLAQALYGT
jgi:hypothetical protein